LPARILVVDDDPLTPELICEILLSASIDASFLTSSSEAAERLYPGTYRSYGSSKTKITYASAQLMATAFGISGCDRNALGTPLPLHQPILALKINELPPANWPTNAEVHGAAMGPFLISHAKFTPRFKILAHEDEPQIPWGVVRLEFRKEAAVLEAIAPRGAHANEASVKNGYMIARQNCFRCHDNKGEGGTKAGRPWQVLAAWAEAPPARFAAYVRNNQKRENRNLASGKGEGVEAGFRLAY